MVDSVTLAKMQKKIKKNEVVAEVKPWYHHSNVRRYRYGGPLRVGLDIFVPLYWFRPLGNYKPVVTMSSCVYLGGYRYYDNPQDVTRQTFFLYDWEETSQPFDYAMVLSDGELSNYFWEHDYGYFDKSRFGGKKFHGVVLNVKDEEITLACDDFVYDFPLTYFDHPVLPLQCVSFTIDNFNQAVKGGDFKIIDMTIWDVAHEQLTQMPFLNNTAFNFAIAARNLLKNKANLKKIANVRKRNRINRKRKNDDEKESKDDSDEISKDEDKKENDQNDEVKEKEIDKKTEIKEKERDLKTETKVKVNDQETKTKDKKTDQETKNKDKKIDQETKNKDKKIDQDTKTKDKKNDQDTKTKEKKIDQETKTKDKKNQETKAKEINQKAETKEKEKDQKSVKGEEKGTGKKAKVIEEEEEITEQEKAIMMDVTKQLLAKLNIGVPSDTEKPVVKEDPPAESKEAAISATDTDPEAPKDKKKPPKPRRPRKPREKKDSAGSNKEDSPASKDSSSSPKKAPTVEEPLSIKDLGDKSKSEGTEENNNSNSSDKNRTDESVDGSPKKKQQRRRPRRRRNPKDGNDQKTEVVGKGSQGEDKPSQD